MKKIFIAFMAAMAIVGCTDEPLGDNGGNTGNGGNGGNGDGDGGNQEEVLNIVTVSASIESIPAGGDAVVNRGGIVWAENDSFSLLGAATDNMKLTLTEGAGTATGTFAGNEEVKTEAGKEYYALYPFYDLAAKEGDGIKGICIPCSPRSCGLQGCKRSR